MVRKLLAIYISLAFTALLAAAADKPASSDWLSAAQIVEKNVAARGGLQAWRTVQTLSLAGKMGVGGNQRAPLITPPANQGSRRQGIILPQRRVEEVQLPFLMELERGRKTRIELQFNGQTAVQVFDGANGWKLRPWLNRHVIEPYTVDEMKITSRQSDLDGFLVDYAAKGTQVEFVGMDQVEGRDTYKLKLTLKDGDAIHVWIDAKTFLEAKIEGHPRRLDGTDHPVEVYYRDYRQVNGLQIPFVLETRVLPVAKTMMGFKDPPVPVEKIIIDKVVVNPKLDESRFSKPQFGIVEVKDGK
ncbi:MAG TPA: outer membrane lipoprotein-sorting protein [Acidobacteriota bacterium]|nr:outer membrane lipoprotein-sorting protein [Acidobacteriota bacterium]